MEIVDIPMKNADFHSCVNVYQRVIRDTTQWLRAIWSYGYPYSLYVTYKESSWDLSFGSWELSLFSTKCAYESKRLANL